MAIPDFTAQEELLLKQVAQTQQNNGFMTRTEVNDIVASYGASFKSTPQFENLTINTGTVTPTRRAQITFIGLITEGNQPFDELDVILADNFHEGDIIVVKNAMRGTQIDGLPQHELANHRQIPRSHGHQPQPSPVSYPIHDRNTATLGRHNGLFLMGKGSLLRPIHRGASHGYLANHGNRRNKWQCAGGCG